VDRFIAMLNRATGFYLWLIEYLRIDGNIHIDTLGTTLLKSDTITSPELDRLRLYASGLQRSFIYLGDLARYRQTYQLQSTQNGEEAEHWYARAAWCAPHSGKFVVYTMVMIYD
jgi:hypothetical protein